MWLDALRNQTPLRFAILALLIRLSCVAALGFGLPLPVEHQIDIEADHWSRSLAHGDGFTNPYLPEERIPTAWRAPLQPLIWAGIYILTRGDLNLYYITIHVLNACAGAAGVWGAIILAQRRFGRRAAWFTGLFLSLFAPAVYYAVASTGDVVMLSAVLSWLLVLADKPLGRNCKRSFALGVLIGVGAILNPISLGVAAIGVIDSTWRFGLPRGGRFIRTLAIPVIAVAICIPWTIRNWRVFHEFVFLRGNLGVMLWAGNHGDGKFYHGGDLLPQFHLLADELRTVGEPELNRRCKARAIAYIRDDPVRFIRASCMRARIFWGKEVWFGQFPWLTIWTTGLPFVLGVVGLLIGLRKKRRVGAFAAIFLFYPGIYYITLAEARYRFPIEPYIVILAAAAIAHWTRPRSGQPSELVAGEALRP